MNKKRGVLIALICVVGALLFGLIKYQLDLRPVSGQSIQTEFEVAQGQTSEEIIHNLHEQGLIRSELAAKIYARLAGKTNFIAGKFQLDSSWRTDTILKTLNDQSKAVTRTIVTVTIPEGSWAKDYASILDQSLDVSAADLLEKWNDADYVASLASDYWFITPEIYNSERVILEGYLFPSTYEFYVDEDVDGITRKILDKTQVELEGYRNAIEEMEGGVHAFVTLASIVQYEGKTREDMEKVASVFFNRMADGMRLQSSVTVCYGLYEYSSWEDCENSTGEYTDYNTYLIDGLPPGPICNPGNDAMDAVANPPETSYYYFVADVDTGEMYFAETYEEHLENVRKYVWKEK